MNNKVSSMQIGMFFMLITYSLYLGLGDVLLLRKSYNEVLIAMIVGSIFGLIPILMTLKINDTYQNLDIFDKNKKLFGKIIAQVINFIIFIFLIFLFTLSIRAIVAFVTSKYLQSTPFYMVAILAVITILITCFKGLETISRISELSFLASILLVIVIEVFLIKYIQIDNILPIIINKKHILGILDGSIYHAFTTGFLSILLLTINKDKIKDKEKYNKTIIISYIVSSITLTIVMFFVLSCFGYNLATLFRYPEYILLKKVGITSMGLHIENLLAFRWLFYILSLSNISLYGIMCYVKKFFKKEKKYKISIVLISIICLIVSKTILGNFPHSIDNIGKYYVPYISGPIFIILIIIFIKCLFTKKIS